MRHTMVNQQEFEALLERAVALIPEKDPTHGTPLREGFKKTLRQQWDNPPVDAYREAFREIQQFFENNGLIDNDDSQQGKHDLQTSFQRLRESYSELDEDMCRKILFFPEKLEMNFYKVVLHAQFTTYGGDSLLNLQKIFLAIFYLVHLQQRNSKSGMWEVIAPFLTNDNTAAMSLKTVPVKSVHEYSNGGFHALCSMFLAKNLQMRSQAVDAFYQLTAVEEVDWHKPPSTERLKQLHWNLFELIDTPFLLYLANNRDSSYPGGSFCCLQIIAWWLSWLRLLHSDGKFRLAESFLSFLREWKKIAEDSVELMNDNNERERQRQEAELANRLVEDFSRFGTVEKDFPSLGGSDDASKRLSNTKSRQLFSDENLHFMNLTVFNTQFSSRDTPGATQQHEEANPVEEDTMLREINKEREKGNRDFRENKLRQAIRIYTDCLSKLNRFTARHGVTVTRSIEVHSLLLKLLSNRANSLYKLSRVDEKCLDSEQESTDSSSEKKNSNQPTETPGLNPVHCLVNCVNDCCSAFRSEIPTNSPSREQTLDNDVFQVVSDAFEHIRGSEFSSQLLLWKILYRLSYAAKYLGQLNIALEGARQCEKILHSVRLFDPKTLETFQTQLRNLQERISEDQEIIQLARELRRGDNTRSSRSRFALEGEIMACLLERTEYGGPGRDVDFYLEEEEAEWSNARARVEKKRHENDRESALQTARENVEYARAGIVSSGTWEDFTAGKASKKRNPHKEKKFPVGESASSKSRPLPEDFVSSSDTSSSSSPVTASLLEKLASQGKQQEFSQKMLLLSPKKLAKRIGSGLSENMLVAVVSTLRSAISDGSISAHRAFKYMINLMELPRFSLTVEFLNPESRSSLLALSEKLLHEASEESEDTKGPRESLVALVMKLKK
eukprot:gb/GECG01010015.1/.p1 GENE.gb/GECG01010015.1/~~gb/GECG01010015.1/.p1  ORF type:complete len:898 (+),score=142.52 gb/GECG01010015.1/:1-2694(+)